MTALLLAASENALFVLILYVFLRDKTSITFKRFLLFVFLCSSFTTITFHYMFDIESRMLINILFHFLAVKFIFLFSYKFSAIVTLIRSALQMLIESIIYVIITYLAIDISIVGFSLFTYIIIALIAIMFYKKHSTLSVLKENGVLNRQIIPIGIIALIQIIVTSITYFDQSLKTITILFTFLLMVSMLFFIFKLMKIQREIVTRNSESLFMGEVEKLLLSIRGQRHDHMNHLHVIANLLSSEKYSEAASYLEDLSTDLEADYSLLKLDQPSLIALLQAKREYALTNYVHLEIIIKHSASRVPLKSYELIQVVGNLVDNAIEEEIASTNKHKRIVVTVDTLYDAMAIFSVNNLNSFIDPSQKSNLFHEGHSRKICHKGLGLPTIANILSKYHGYIEIDSDKIIGTTFFVFVPYQNTGD